MPSRKTAAAFPRRGDNTMNQVLIDTRGRIHDYLRISVTDKCNLRCRYCMPPQGVTLLTHDQVLHNEEFLRLMMIFQALGVKKIRFTGGEPLVRRGFMDLLAKAAASMPGIDWCLTTNGLLLEENLEQLKDAGLRKINISLDTLFPDRYRFLTGSDVITRVTGAIERAVAMKAFTIKINVVLFRETLQELDAFLDFCQDRDVTLRFIELMPTANGDPELEYVSAESMIRELGRRGELVRNGPGDTRVARMYHLAMPGRRPIAVGVIPPISEKFCARCNRVRLSCDGKLRVCLCGDSAEDLKTPLRSGADDAALAALIKECLAGKPLEHRIACSPTDRECSYLPSMSSIGG